jgi:hypothetical protein
MIKQNSLEQFIHDPETGTLSAKYLFHPVSPASGRRYRPHGPYPQKGFPATRASPGCYGQKDVDAAVVTEPGRPGTGPYKVDLKTWQDRLINWSQNWENLSGESEFYALCFMLVHLEGALKDVSADSFLAEKNREELLQRMSVVVENEAFRKRMFADFGNDLHLKSVLMAIQRLLIFNIYSKRA